jgi:hypothetical protein
MATEPVQTFWRRKKYGTTTNQTTIPRSSNTQSFHYFDRENFLSYSDFFYLFICGLFLQLITLNDTHIHTLGRTPLDAGSARRRDLYQTTYDTHKKQRAMRPAGLEPAIPANERWQTHVLEGVAIVIGYRDIPSPIRERPGLNFHSYHTKINNQLWFKNVLLCLRVSVHFIPFVSSAQQFHPVKTKCRLLYLKTQSVPRSKHFSYRL